MSRKIKGLVQLNFEISSDLKKLFDELYNRLKFDAKFNIRNRNDLFIILFNSYLANSINFNDEDLKIFNEAVNISEKTKEEFIKSAILSQAKRLANNKDKENPKTKEAHLKLDKFIYKLIKNNDETKNKEDKKFINQTLILREIAKEGKGFNVDMVRKYLEQSHIKEMLLRHHKDHGLDENHNREMQKIKRLNNSKYI